MGYSTLEDMKSAPPCLSYLLNTGGEGTESPRPLSNSRVKRHSLPFQAVDALECLVVEHYFAQVYIYLYGYFKIRLVDVTRRTRLDNVLHHYSELFRGILSQSNLIQSTIVREQAQVS